MQDLVTKLSSTSAHGIHLKFHIVCKTAMICAQYLTRVVLSIIVLKRKVSSMFSKVNYAHSIYFF